MLAVTIIEYRKNFALKTVAVGTFDFTVKQEANQEKIANTVEK